MQLLSSSFYQWTPLHIAAKEGNVLIVKLLVKAGTGINIRSDDGVSVYECILLRVDCSC